MPSPLTPEHRLSDLADGVLGPDSPSPSPSLSPGPLARRKKPWWKWRTMRLGLTLGPSSVIFLAEVIVGSITRSNALMADAFHVLSDMLGLVIGIAAIQIGKRDTSSGGYRAKRIEVLGALVNGVFVLALCLSIVMSAVERLFKPEEIENPQLLLITGAIGLAVNVIGLFVVGDGGHGHSHSHSHGSPADTPLLELTLPSSTAPETEDDDLHADLHEQQQQQQQQHDHGHSHGHGGDLNIRGVFLHILGDALGSVAVVISALIISYTNWPYAIYVDPALSLLIALILATHSIPLVRSTAEILLLDTPKRLDVAGLRDDILSIPGVRAIHELHVWQLTSERVVSSAHVGVASLDAYTDAGPKIHAAFHQRGVHSVTVQPEFLGHGPLAELLPPTSPGAVVLDVAPAACFLDCSSLAGTDERCRTGGLSRRRVGARAARRACGDLDASSDMAPSATPPTSDPSLGRSRSASLAVAPPG
ncbi:hypothetical protein H696_04176 [Fonticula alba]|uniref:CDF family cation efflux system protein n=1 Tax=Fonticula alba TaxID=691883 RepID=A0A058Z899_FONAL|nr:hypothetical protein H696_04176 [Fonticula alba]KCV69767.1 hypothetical protein H696_04176 [Fonticula alba]|eukprot:XP_009496332.1 hypothetical protein H696_04176 [Fonticula alba]